MVRGPDIAYIGEERLAAGEPIFWADYAPDLAVEILSPSDSPSAMTEKVMEYLEAGARLVWVVDAEGRRVTVYQSRSNVRVVAESDFLTGEDVLPDLRIDLSVIFGD